MDLDGGSPGVKTAPAVGKTWSSMGQVRADDLRPLDYNFGSTSLSASHQDEIIYPPAVKTYGGIAESMRV